MPNNKDYRIEDTRKGWRIGMIVSDGYVLEYIPKYNQIIINLPPTMTTISNTVAMVSNRRTNLTVTEEAAILSIVKAIMETDEAE